MRDGWTETTLGKVAKRVPGKYIPKSEYVENGEYFIYGSNSVMGKYSKPLISEPHTVMAAIGAYAGAVRFSLEPSWVNNNAFALITNSAVNPKYFYLWLDTQLDLTQVVAGTGQPYVQLPALNSIRIPLPPLAEQHRIVDLVSSVDTYITSLEQQVDAARTARNAVLHELLSAGGDDWTETTLKQIGDSGLFIDGDWVESKDQDSCGTSRLLQLADIGDGVFLNKSDRWMNDEQFLRLRCTELEPNDILIARMPDPIARACLVPKGLPRCATVVDVAILRCGSQYDPKFIVMALNDATFRTSAQSLLTGTTRQRISRSNLSRLSILLPPNNEQRRIVDLVSSMDDVVASAEHAVIKVKALRSGLLSDLLSGEHEIPESYDSLLGVA